MHPLLAEKLAGAAGETFAIYADAVICFGGLIFAGIRMLSGRFQDAIRRLFGALFVPECSAGVPVGLDSQREDVRPYKEAQSFQSLLDLRGYNIAAFVREHRFSDALPKRQGKFSTCQNDAGLNFGWSFPDARYNPLYRFRSVLHLTAD